MRIFTKTIATITLASLTGVLNAALVLSFDDNNTPGIEFEIVDNGPDDMSSVAGFIQYQHDDAQLTVFATAESKPDRGTDSLPDLLLSVNFLRHTGGNLGISLTDTGFNVAVPSTGKATILNGFIQGGKDIEWEFFGDTNNQERGRSFDIVSAGPVDSPAPTIQFPDLQGSADPVGSLTMFANVNGPDDTAPPFEFTTSYVQTLKLEPQGAPPPPAKASLAASSLPSSRSVQANNLASAFATIINTSSITATSCSLSPLTDVAASFTYQTTDATNVPVGTPNLPVDIPAGNSQSFIFGFEAPGSLGPLEVLMSYECTNSDRAPVTVGLNTLLLSISSSPVPDIVALAATQSGDGIVNLSGTNGSNAFAVSTVNVGSTGTITASPFTLRGLPLSLSICETDPATAACLSGPGSSATSSVSVGATPTYSVFVTGTGTVPFDPANNRIIVEFKDAGGRVRGSTSVAVRTQ